MFSGQGGIFECTFLKFPYRNFIFEKKSWVLNYNFIPYSHELNSFVLSIKNEKLSYENIKDTRCR